MIECPGRALLTTPENEDFSCDVCNFNFVILYDCEDYIECPSCKSKLKVEMSDYGSYYTIFVNGNFKMRYKMFIRFIKCASKMFERAIKMLFMGDER